MDPMMQKNQDQNSSSSSVDPLLQHLEERLGPIGDKFQEWWDKAKKYLEDWKKNFDEAGRARQHELAKKAPEPKAPGSSSAGEQSQLPYVEK